MGHYVYKYVLNGEIIYIGKNDTDLHSRIKSHGRPGDNIPKQHWDEINSAKIYYIELANSTMSDVVESELIRRYMPKYNKAKKSDWCGINFIEPEWKEYIPNQTIVYKNKKKSKNYCQNINKYEISEDIDREIDELNREISANKETILFNNEEISSLKNQIKLADEEKDKIKSQIIEQLNKCIKIKDEEIDKLKNQIKSKEELVGVKWEFENLKSKEESINNQLKFWQNIAKQESCNSHNYFDYYINMVKTANEYAKLYISTQKENNLLKEENKMLHKEINKNILRKMSDKIRKRFFSI